MADAMVAWTVAYLVALRAALMVDKWVAQMAAVRAALLAVS